jgi:hypothetical protein
VIKKGDLVMVVSGCPDCGYRAGAVFTVVQVKPPKLPGYRCFKCNWSKVTNELGASSNGKDLIPLSWLKKIDPPSTGELDRVPVRMKEPA